MRAAFNRRQFALGALGLAGCAHAGASAGDDIVVRGGPIYTGVEAGARVQAVRISGGRFVALGGDVSAAGARVIELGGAAAFPGFKDSHVHLGGVGMAAMVLDLVGVASIAELQQRLGAYAARHRDGPIIGRGWLETHWPEARFPNRADLDVIVGDRPVYLERIDGHAAVANSAALALAGVDAATIAPEGGAIEHDETGAPTGMLIDNATGLVERRLPSPTLAMRREGLAQAMALYASRGWTAAANMSTSAEEAAILGRFADSGEMAIFVNAYLTPEAAQEMLLRGPYNRGTFNVCGVKHYVDGALGSRGAALLAPYSDAPGDGLLVTAPDELRAGLEWARVHGLQAATHAIGDHGNRIALDLYRDVFADDPEALRSGRWRIEHAQVLAPDDIARFGEMGVIASMQASHAISDLYFAPSRLGAERLSGAYAWRSLLDSGAVIAAGSDAPVERGDPLIEFYAACYRHSLGGEAGPSWHLEQAMSRHEALRALTWGGAFATFSEDACGTIEVGKRADISVFSSDLMRVEPEEIPRSRALLTIAGGRVVHDAL
jgi:hypothetical protein